jgi:hypothetical protein
VHYAANGSGDTAREIDVIGEEGLRVIEGVVTRLDHRGSQITVRYTDGKMETFRLTERAAAEASKDAGQASSAATRVVIYYTDEDGRRVAHFSSRGCLERGRTSWTRWL